MAIEKVKCNRCGFEWFPRTEAPPKWCAKCKSPYWNKPRVKGIKKLTERLV